MIILFVVDTSASMNQKYSNGFSLLDCAKNGVEHLVKVRKAQENERKNERMPKKKERRRKKEEKEEEEEEERRKKRKK